MKNIFVFYLYIFLPILLPISMVLDTRIKALFPPDFALYFLIAYVLVYHPLISGIRLLESKKIKVSQLPYNFIPGWNSKFFDFLFFNKGA